MDCLPALALGKRYITQPIETSYVAVGEYILGYSAQ